VDPDKRISAKDALLHPWIIAAGGDSSPVVTKSPKAVSPADVVESLQRRRPLLLVTL
jgi:hypothetical protein